MQNYKVCCPNCKYFIEDPPVNYAECSGIDKYPDAMTEEQFEKIFYNNGEDCTLFEVSDLVKWEEKIMKEMEE